MTLTKIRLVETLFTDEEIKNIDFDLITIIKVFNGDNLSQLEFLAKHKLIKNENICGTCFDNMKLYKNCKEIFKYRWVCRSWKRIISVLQNSILSECRINLEKFLSIVFMWSASINQNVLCESLKINKNTVSKWFSKFRHLCEENIAEETGYLGGISGNGEPIDVEIDESLFFKRKFNRGRTGNPVWVFGAVERLSGKCFFFPFQTVLL